MTKLRKNASLKTVAEHAVRKANAARRRLSEHFAHVRALEADPNRWRDAAKARDDLKPFTDWNEAAELAWHLARLAKIEGPADYTR